MKKTYSIRVIMNMPNSAAKKFPIIKITLSRFVINLIWRDDGDGMMSAFTDSPVWGIERESPKMARIMGEKSFASFVLVFEFDFLSTL